MQKKKQTKPIKQIIIYTLLVILVLLLTFAEDIIKLANKNKIALQENNPNETILVEPNPPHVVAGMIPVKWDGEKWTITTREDKDWYDYKSGKPAYVMLNDGYYRSEIERGVEEKQLMENNVGVGVPDDPSTRGTILMWIPRFAYNEDGDIQYIKDIELSNENWTIPDIFTHKQVAETAPDFLLTGIWLEKDVDTNYANKIATMNTKDSIYGFIKNTIAVPSDKTTGNTIQKYIENNENTSDTVGASIARPQIDDITNPNRVILKIINQKNQDPIKAKASYNKDTGLIEVQVTYTQYGIEKILYENTSELKLEKNGRQAQATSEGIDVKDGERTITIIDNNGNQKKIKVQVVSRIYATLYTDGTLAFGKTQNPLPEKTVSRPYGEVPAEGYLHGAGSIPWYNNSAVKTATFVDEIYITSTASFFDYCYYLTKVENMHNLKGVTDMSSMFNKCDALTEIDVSNLDTSKVTDMHYMFCYCSNLTKLDVSNWDTSNVTNMNTMFYRCSSLTELDVSNWNTSKVTNMQDIFNECSTLTQLDVSNWDTSNVTNMYGMFYYCSNLTQLNVSNFDTSKVTDMAYMFPYCRNLTQLDVSNFDTSNVTNMTYMFYDCRNLTSLDLSSFDTSKVTNVNNIFNNCPSLAQISFGENWTKTVTLPTLTKPCSGWYSDADFTNKVAEAGANYTPAGPITIYANVPPDIYVKLYTDGTLAFCSNNSQIPFKELSQDYGNIAGKEYSTASSKPWYSNISEIETVEFIDEIKPTSTSNWFNGCSKTTTKHIENLNTSNVTNMRAMFVKCETLTKLDLSNFDTKNVTDMASMFHSCVGLLELNLSGWNTSNVTDMYNMFTGCSSLTSLDLGNFDTSNITGMYNMFSGCSNLTQLDLSNFDTSNVTDMGYMFNNCSSLSSLDLSNFDTSKVTNVNNIFNNCPSLTQISFGEKWNKQVTLPTPSKEGYKCTGWYSDAEFTTKVAGVGASYTPQGPITIYANMSPLMYAALYTDSDETILAFGKTENPLASENKTPISTYGDITNREYNTNTLPWRNERGNITTVKFVDEVFPTSTQTWFWQCSKLEKIVNIEKLNTSNVTNMLAMFSTCNSLQELDVSKFDTSKVTNMGSMFNGCSGLTTLDVSNFDTSKVTNMVSMFYNCSGLTTLDVSNFDTSKVTNMGDMFAYCRRLTQLDVSNFDTSKVTSMNSMFNNCSGLNNINLASFNTSNVTNMNYMFYDCIGLNNIDLSPLDTSSVINMAGMFGECNGLTQLDLSPLNTTKVTNMNSMFIGCTSLTSLDLNPLDTSNVTDMGSMFVRCDGLIEIDVSNFDTRNTTDMSYMFANCKNLRTVYVGKNWVTDKANTTDMFWLSNNISSVTPKS